jgi:hypothetical protein
MTGKGATIDIGVWLRDLDLEQYEAAFRDNAISENILPSLTAEDLKDLGVGLVRWLIKKQTKQSKGPSRR